jgi:uncharacterized membrane protein YdjX (TVP38/TMEM64 family)
MKSLLKIIFSIVIIFITIFLITKSLNILTVEQLEYWIEQVSELSIFYAASIVVFILFMDLFIAIPTLTVIILSGYLFGSVYGALVSLVGVSLAGTCGYALTRYYRNSILSFLVKDKNKRDEAINIFQKHGFTMILLSRAMPILPETSACLAGMTRMSFLKFITAWLISSVPYILIATYAGSISSFNNPKPAIFTAIGLTAFFWIAWYIYHRMITIR